MFTWCSSSLPRLDSALVGWVLYFDVGSPPCCCIVCAFSCLLQVSFVYKQCVLQLFRLSLLCLLHLVADRLCWSCLFFSFLPACTWLVSKPTFSHLCCWSCLLTQLSRDNCCDIVQHFLHRHRHRHRQHHHSPGSTNTDFELVASHDAPLTHETASAPAHTIANGQSQDVPDVVRENRRQSAAGQRKSADRQRTSHDSQRPPTSQRRMHKAAPVSILPCNLFTL